MKITLCGSTRFAEAYQKINDDLTLAGHIVYSVASLPDVQPATKNEMYDLVHMLKILNSDAIVVIDRNKEFDPPYIGESTRREILWATMLDRKIYFWSDLAKLSRRIV